MKSLTRTIIVLVVFNLLTANLALGQNAPEGKLSTYTISGSVGLSSVEMQGLPGNPVTASDGTYKATVEQGWSGTVAPVKEGYTFRPYSRTYRRVVSNQTNQNYVAEAITYTISGGIGLRGVIMHGLPGNVVTNSSGYYTATVEHGWSGTVRPTKEGCNFEPSSKTYTKVTHEYANQNYIAELITCTISHVIKVGGSPIQGVRVEASNGGGSDITDAQGRFSVKVPYGWSGEITLEKKGYRFPSKSYTNITENYRDDLPVSQLPVSRRGRTVRRTGGRKVLVIPDSDVKPEEFDAITQDLLVMSHIFDERFREPRLVRGRLVGKVFTDFGDFFGRDSRATEAIYLQGYGALFLMEVNFAFSPPPKAQEKQAEETEDVDPTWQRARQQIFSPKGLGGGSEFVSEDRDGAEKIEVLKTELIKTLKHAANIRNLKPDEWVILTVIGQGRQSGEFYEDYYRSATPGSITSRSGRRRSSSSGVGGYAASGGYSVAGGSARTSASSYGHMMGRMGGMAGGMYGGMEYGGMSPPSVTILTIRAKKSDVDAFAASELDFEQFQQKVEIFTY